MKYLSAVFVLFLLFSCQPKPLPTVFEQDENRVLVKLSYETTKNDLNRIKDGLSASNFDFDYSGSEFFDDGKVQILNLRVSTPEGHTGTTRADVVNLSFKYYGFLYQKDGSPTFRIGDVNSF